MATRSRTNLGPLTTPFTYPASCTVNVLQCSTCNVAWQGQVCSDNPNNDQGVEDNPDCWPARSNPDVTTAVAFGGWGYYSPGLECPVGYATACTATGSATAGFVFEYVPLASETVVGCCPTDYTCLNIGAGQTCVSYASTSSFPAVQCASGSSNGFHYAAVPTVVFVSATTVGTTTVPATTLDIDTVTLYAPLFQLVHQPTDLLSTSSSSPPLSAPTHSTGNPSGTPSQTAPPHPSSTGLSSGAIAGIAVGSVVGGLGLLAALVFLFVSQRRKRRLPAQHGGGDSRGAYDAADKNAPAPNAVYEVPEAPPRHELP
ncbi:hypothetical protein SPI_07209 [Niveomyces insectorum RCEF 264]|uniref:Uncharacterized protein n=1 Tax=Niveomyces insectorum RCEF 264 TaxID=1081102 RepID=A0A167QDU4_9HYPO|nr:hypothetical protein SPI_07209 [Niveomyces insectorum RCEF 264]